jgi:hypothetical protein
MQPLEPTRRLFKYRPVHSALSVAKKTEANRKKIEPAKTA